MKTIDTFLNTITMYRLVLYSLLVYVAYAVGLGYMGILPYTPMAQVLSIAYITFVCWIVNEIFSRVFNAPTNTESFYITALILFFLITPLTSWTDMAFYSLATWAAALAMASKYILAIRKKHVFNPAAIAVVVTSFVLGQAASWWIGTSSLFIPVCIGGFLIVRKLRCFDLVLTSLMAALVFTLAPHLASTSDIMNIGKQLLLDSPLIFFATIMLTEPLTTPPTKYYRLGYGVLTGFLFSPLLHVASFYTTPELALVVGNVYSYIVSPKEKVLLALKRIEKIGTDTYDYIFGSDQKLSFQAGQYLEWTLPHNHVDDRGNRRYFTIASSPTENDLHFGIKFYSPASSFKYALAALPRGGTFTASSLAGDFVLPKDKNKKLVFIAGGIGITPFRSHVKYLIDTHEKRSIVLFYSNNALADISYSDVFDEGYNEFGLKTVYTLTDLPHIPETWKGERGFIDANMIARHAPDFHERIFYISGPHAMVTRYEEVLARMGVKKSQIKTDFFPGYA